MAQFLLSVHTPSTPDEATAGPPAEMTPEDMQRHMAAIEALEAEMRASGTFVFSARLTDAADAKVVRSATSMTDGPFAEAKEHIAGFYIIEAETHDDALAWATKVVECVSAPIEVRPFFASDWA